MKQAKTNITLCPVAWMVGCIKCPIFAACPVKHIIGYYPEPDKPLNDPNKPKS